MENTFIAACSLFGVYIASRMFASIIADGLRDLNRRTTSKNNTMSLTFDSLRAANLARLPVFKNSKGELAHSKPDGSDWSPAQWLQAVTGELGEYANVRKKFERGDIDEATFQVLAANELADVQTYLDILAFQLGIDLGQATMDKWNRVSEKIGCGLVLHCDRLHQKPTPANPAVMVRFPTELSDLYAARQQAASPWNADDPV